jgi:hypothetical protein
MAKENDIISYWETGHCLNHCEVVDIYVMQFYYNNKLVIDRHPQCSFESDLSDCKCKIVNNKFKEFKLREVA